MKILGLETFFVHTHYNRDSASRHVLIQYVHHDHRPPRMGLAPVINIQYYVIVT